MKTYENPAFDDPGVEALVRDARYRQWDRYISAEERDAARRKAKDDLVQVALAYSDNLCSLSRFQVAVTAYRKAYNLPD